MKVTLTVVEAGVIKTLIEEAVSNLREVHASQRMLRARILMAAYEEIVAAADRELANPGGKR